MVFKSGHFVFCLNNWKKILDIKSGKTEGRIDLLVGEEVVVTRKVSSSVLNATVDMPVRHFGKNVQNTVGEFSLDFRGEI